MTKVLPSQNLSLSTMYHGFVLERIQPIAELNTTGYLFMHQKSGARLIHLYNDDPDNLFSIAFKTPVSDSTGVPHILEHSVLCGSKRYPVKDPFQEMLKGSLQTFLNALTYPDKTVYPVSSQVEKDFFNLVSIYADAVFNPLISDNTFYQEGWHFDVEDPEKPVGIKGIVYNEMKGVFSNFSSHVVRRTQGALFPETTYHFESGGAPEHITDLTYEQFTDFHRTFYHPSNSYIILYGNIPSVKTLAFLDEQFLDSFTASAKTVEIAAQPLWSSPRSCNFTAPSPQEDKGTATVTVAWIFGESADPLLSLAGRILSYYLLDTESSPLKRALIDSGLGEDLSDLSGFDSDLRQSVFAAGLRKSKPENADKIEKLILDTLQSMVKNGIDFELLEGALRQIEFRLREVTSGHFPYNLRVAERCYRSWIYGGDPFAHCAFEAPLVTLQQHVESRDGFFANLITSHLIKNNHRLLSTVTASPEMGEQLERQTSEQAEKLSKNFTDADKNRYAELTRTLLKQQMAPSDPAALAKLPKLDVADLPVNGIKVPTEVCTISGIPAHLHQQFTSGIAYLDLGFDIRNIDAALLPYVPLYCEYITRCGAGSFTYEQMATRIARATGGVDASVSCKTVIGSSDDVLLKLFFHTKSLLSRFGETLDILKDVITNPDFTNEKLLKDILLEERNNLTTAVIGSGHRFALTMAASQLLPARAIDEELGGIAQLRFLEAQVRQDNLPAVMKALIAIHACVIDKQSSCAVLTFDDPKQLTAPLTELIKVLPVSSKGGSRITVITERLPLPQGIEISSAVNFIGKVWKLPPVDAEAAGRLMLISKLLSAGYLWDKVRVEGGAYGGMSSMSIAHPVFTCASYRDPNLVTTLGHFKAGLEMVASGLPVSVVNQNIIGTIGQLDSPMPPHGKCYNESVLLFIGATEDFRKKMRESVLSSTPQNLAATARSILDNNENATVVLGSQAAFDKAEKEGFTCNREGLTGLISQDQ